MDPRGKHPTSRRKATWIGITYLALAGLMAAKPELTLQKAGPVAHFVFGPGGCGSSGGGVLALLALLTVGGIALTVHPTLGAWSCAALGLTPIVIWSSSLASREVSQLVAMALFAASQASVAWFVLRQPAVTAVEHGIESRPRHGS